MKNFIKNCLLFGLPVVLVVLGGYFFLKQRLTDAYGPATYTQVAKQFKDVATGSYDAVILGNSKLYRGVNPAGMTIPTYNFAHDSDSYNQEYYKLKYLKDQGINFKYLILGIDYFHFSEWKNQRNYAYVDYFPSQYIEDYKGDTGNLSEFFNVINPKTLGKLRSDTTYRCRLLDNGLYIKDTPQKIYTKKDFERESANILPIQKMYFEKIIAFCKEQNIKIFLLMPPTLDMALDESYDKEELNKWKEYVSSVLKDNPKITYLNLSKASGFTQENYTDNLHLDSESALRFAKVLDKAILEKL